MKKEELLKKLIKAKANKSDYSLEGGLPNEAYCLEKLNEGWQVYYSERGGKSFPKKFKTEDEACDYFYKKIINEICRPPN